MLASFCVASTKPEAALDRARLVCLAAGEGGLWRCVIAGQKPPCIAGRGTDGIRHVPVPGTGTRL